MKWFFYSYFILIILFAQANEYPQNKLQVDSLILSDNETVKRNQELEAINKDLSEKIELLINRLEESDSTFNEINTYFSVIACVLGVFAILLPLITYLAGVLPARQAIKNLEKQVHDALILQERKVVNNALEKLHSETEKSRYESALLLSGRLDYNFNNDDLKRIVEAHDKETDLQIKSKLMQILSTQESLISYAFFKKELEKNNLQKNLYYVLRYASISLETNFYSEIIESVHNSDQPVELYLSIVNLSLNISFRSALTFLNDPQLVEFIIDSCTNTKLQSMKEGFKEKAKTYDEEEAKNLETSHFYEKKVSRGAVN